MTEPGITESTATPEAPVNIKRFTPEAKESLEKEGYVVYELTGQSIKTLRDSGRKFHASTILSQFDENLASMQSEVAINPNQVFLRGSNNSTLKKQEDMVAEFSAKLSEKIKGVKAVIGQAPDYAELLFRHFDETQQNFLITENNWAEDDLAAVTETLIGKSEVVCVGGFLGRRLDSNGIYFGGGWTDTGGEGVGVAPLVIPFGK